MIHTFQIRHFLFLAFFSFAFQQTSFSQASEWELTFNKDDLEVFTRSNTDSKIKEIRIKTTIKTNLNNLFSVLADVDNYPSWVYKGMNSRSLQAVNEDAFYYYTASNFPFPFSNRDLIVLSKKWYDEPSQTWFSHSQAKPEHLPEENGFVRIQSFDSYWKIKDLGNETVCIDYTACTDPGGMLPAWIINLGITTGPVKTMTALKKILENPDSAESWTVE